jgi:hypothetical protein
VPGVEVSQQFAEIGRLAAIKIAIAVGRVAVSILPVPIQQAERDECIEEVASTTFVNADPANQAVEVLRAFGKDREYVKLNGAQQRLRSPEGVADIENSAW